MPRTAVRFVKTYATRLSPSDIAKLEELCGATNTAPSELFRHLLHTAHATGVPPIAFAAPARSIIDTALEERTGGEDDGHRK